MLGAAGRLRMRTEVPISYAGFVSIGITVGTVISSLVSVA